MYLSSDHNFYSHSSDSSDPHYQVPLHITLLSFPAQSASSSQLELGEKMEWQLILCGYAVAATRRAFHVMYQIIPKEYLKTNGLKEIVIYK